MNKIVLIYVAMILLLLGGCSSNINVEEPVIIDEIIEEVNQSNLTQNEGEYDLTSLIITVNTDLIETTNSGGIRVNSSEKILDILSLTIDEFVSLAGFEISNFYTTIPSFVVSISYIEPDFSNQDKLDQIIDHLLLNEEFLSVDKNYISDIS